MTSDLRQIVLAITLIACVHSSDALAQLDSPSKARYANHDACVTCHFPKPGEQGVAARSRDFVQTTPATVWENEDKHRRAFTLLLEKDNLELVRGMLGFDLGPVIKNGELVSDTLQPPQLARLKQCLHCHAGRPTDDGSPVLNLELGVSCQACHGPGQLWDEVHQFQEWRLVNPREKERLHMTDVRSPVTRAKLCASCHVGDAKQQRVVTHEMYANGHPPLPTFELDAFAAQMPPHWRNLPDKPMFLWWNEPPANFDDRINKWLKDNGTIFDSATQRPVTIGKQSIQRSYRAANYADQVANHDPRQDLPHTRGAIVAGAVVLRSYLTLLTDMTDTASSDHRAWPEFAVFDCTACHHELRIGPLVSGRPFRRSPPGRPPMQLWPATLARLGIVHLAGESPDAVEQLASFDQRLRVIEVAATRQPFGDSRQIHAAAVELTAQLDTFSERLEHSRFDVVAAKRALRFLTDAQHHEIRDYHTARQLAWAIRQIMKDLAPGDDALAKTLFITADRKDLLSLNLPAGQEKSVVRNLACSLEAIAKYDPKWFAAELKRIRELVAVE